MKRAFLLAPLTVICMAGLAEASADAVKSALSRILRTQAINGLKLAQCEVQELHLPNPDDLAQSRRGNKEVVVSVPLSAGPCELVLRPHSLRAPNFRLLVQRADGIHEE